MPENQITPGLASASGLAARFRMAGIIILLAGLLGAGLVYWLSPAVEVLPDELATPENNKRSARDVSSNFGQMGTFSYALAQDLKDPVIRAGVVAVTSVLLAFGCFYLAHLQERITQAGGPPARDDAPTPR